MTADRLTLARAFEDAGITREKAEKVAQVVMDAIHDNVATKADLAEIRQEMVQLKHDLTMRGLAGLSAGLGILFAALHIWPAH